MRSLTLLLCIALLTAVSCSDTVPVEPPADDMPDMIEAPSSDETPDVMPDVEEPPVEDMVSMRPPGPLLETFTYTRQYQDCTTIMCLTQIQFGIRGGVVWWRQSGGLTQPIPLNDTEYDELVELVGELTFLEMMQRGFSCPASNRDGFRVEFMLQVEREDGTSMVLTDDVTGCYYEEGEDHAERLIAFSEEIFLTYYK